MTTRVLPEWFKTWIADLMAASGASHHFGAMTQGKSEEEARATNALYWSTIFGVFDRNKVTPAEAVEIREWLIVNGHIWPDKLAMNIVTAIRAIRPSVAPPPPVMGVSADEEWSYVRRELARMDRCPASEIADGRVYRVIRRSGRHLLNRHVQTGEHYRAVPDSVVKAALDRSIREDHEGKPFPDRLKRSGGQPVRFGSR